ncbi:unnamed protein product [Oncorhynchus mykiss]|uniref:Uncharacterized protein n=1 Tax=Oncorhynchus mykiss TaxID=8022 RepID=A0A060YKH1_ONCMY|nr:unnamed protein product [Oncorhynchus mykiss]
MFLKFPEVHFRGVFCRYPYLSTYNICLFLRSPDCLNCSRITALTDRLSSLEAKVQVLSSPASTSHRHLQGKGGLARESSSQMVDPQTKGAPGEQGPIGMYKSPMPMYGQV